MLIQKPNNEFSLNEIGEIGVTLLAYESKYLYRALGVAVLSDNICTIMETIEIFSHSSANLLEKCSYFEEIGKKTINSIKTQISDSYYTFLGNPRNEIKINFKQIKKICLTQGYNNAVIPLIVSVMVVRGL
ncbi:hypothetical protein LI071_04715 [Bacillus subtilis]|uniref:hypothetical protein n=1 Tax=Bacillus subtilis TaxID=1423 RepID=UPI001D0760EE|nr:hypothetical protein [Bacillus subtilis]MCB7159975.1 hypothetical protein [Bacillus subtilis]MCB7459027.1 hypothetical protein [Bacillus subtilis]